MKYFMLNLGWNERKYLFNLKYELMKFSYLNMSPKIVIFIFFSVSVCYGYGYRLDWLSPIPCDLSPLFLYMQTLRNFYKPCVCNRILFTYMVNLTFRRDIPPMQWRATRKFCYSWFPCIIYFSEVKWCMYALSKL